VPEAAPSAVPNTMPNTGQSAAPSTAPGGAPSAKNARNSGSAASLAAPAAQALAKTPATAKPATAPSPSGRDDRKASAQARQALAAKTRPLRQELTQAEQRIAKLGSERGQIEADIVAGQLSGPQMAEAGRRLNHIAAEVAMLEERWLELTEQIEAVEAGA